MHLRYDRDVCSCQLHVAHRCSPCLARHLERACCWLEQCWFSQYNLLLTSRLPRHRRASHQYYRMYILYDYIGTQRQTIEHSPRLSNCNATTAGTS